MFDRKGSQIIYHEQEQQRAMDYKKLLKEKEEMLIK